jgi:hypothetical protein
MSGLAAFIPASQPIFRFASPDGLLSAEIVLI